MDEESTWESPQRRGRREHTYPAGHVDHELPEGVEPDFTDEVGTTDPIEAVEDGEPYFPPTDPVIAPASKAEEGVEVVGGFTPTSMDDVGAEGETELGQLPGDEQIHAAVVRELREDALTADLRIAVVVRDGVVHLRGRVPSLEDADAAEEVAARVEGVAEVMEELEIAEQAAR
ncbi:MAG: BON domain-containing protein [Chloroflexi bacterium]|nr:BON domain-containing protein [Chloroflexota bacterium]